MVTTRNSLWIGVAAVLLWLSADRAPSQEPPVAAIAGARQEATTERARGDRRDGDAEKGRPEDRKLAAIQRHATPPKPPNPNELKVKPDKHGKLRFSFEGQPWEAILEWLADCAGMSLDWQDLPGDYLNLSTPPGRSYTVREARDLINRYLLARGYTILTQGNVLSVVNVAKLNPVMVPRVDREQLEELVKQEPNAFVKVSIPLGWVSAETAVEELKPMLSPSGKLTALKESNRLESMDAAVNLYDILQMLETEQSEQSQEGLVRKFVLNHGKAAEVCDQLKELMGLEAKPGRSGVSPERLATMMARAGRVIVVGRQEAQTQPPAGQPGGAAAAAKPKVDVSFAVNPRENSIVAVAPPEKMMIVAQAIKALDTPAKEGASSLATVQRWNVYRLASIEPEPVIQTLQDLGSLDPRTRLQADRKNHAIVAFASLADHVTIRSLVERLDGNGRTFYVIPLKRLDAEYVADTIESTMTNLRNEKLHVEPDVDRNRIVVWADSRELEEVRGLLEKFGENTTTDESSTFRVLELPAGKDRADVLEWIRRKWPSVGPNPLVFPSAAPPKTEPAPAAPKTDPPRARPPSG